ncbi:hypothetical protein FQA39_LY07667 [Lamprigera yunnana]|nr:hypothetical protein FQA39_LY07667 [Lamprigera yunnana]
MNARHGTYLDTTQPICNTRVGSAQSGTATERLECSEVNKIRSRPTATYKQVYPPVDLCSFRSEELLIESVREYTFLYDPSDAGYHDNKKKDNAWTQISKKFEGWPDNDIKN